MKNLIIFAILKNKRNLNFASINIIIYEYPNNNIILTSYKNVDYIDFFEANQRINILLYIF